MADEITPTATPTPAPETAPAAPPPAPESPPAAPEGAPPAAASPEDDGPAHVPYAKFREVQTGYTRAQREWAARERQLQQQYERAVQEAEPLRRFQRDYQVLEELIQANPDLAEQLAERARGGGAPGMQRPQGPIRAELPPELVEKLKSLDDIAGFVKQSREQQTRAAQAAEEREAMGQLDGMLKQKIIARGFSEKLLPHARQHVLARIREASAQGSELDFEDVPYLVNEFLRDLDAEVNARQQALVAGKRQDLAAVPPAPGAGAAPPPAAAARAPFGANDQQTREFLVQKLQEMGWSNNGGA